MIFDKGSNTTVKNMRRYFLRAVTHLLQYWKLTKEYCPSTLSTCSTVSSISVSCGAGNISYAWKILGISTNRKSGNTYW